MAGELCTSHAHTPGIFAFAFIAQAHKGKESTGRKERGMQASRIKGKKNQRILQLASDIVIEEK